MVDEKKTIKHNNIIKKILYALKKIWYWDKAFFMYFILLTPVTVVLPLAEIYFPKVIIDIVELKESIVYIAAVVIIYFSLLFFLNCIRSLCSTRIEMRRYNASLMYQFEITEKYMRTDFSNTDNPEKNVMYQNAMNDACSGNCAPEFIANSLFDFLTSLLGIFSFGTIIMIISPWILAFLIFSAILTYLLGSRQRSYSEKHKNERAMLDRKVWYLSGFSSKFDYAKDIRIFGMQDWIGKMLSHFQREQFKWTKKISLRAYLGNCIEALLSLILEGMTYAVLIIMLLNGQIGVGDFVFLFGAVTGFSVWLKGISYKLNDIVEKSVKIQYYIDYFGIRETYNHGAGCQLPSGTELPAKIEFQNVSYKYCSNDNEKYALKNINLTIHKGEKLAVVGANGAGKTTLVKLLCGFYYPSEGIVRLNGRKVEEYNIEEYYTLFSAVFQDIYLLPISIKEFICSCNTNADENKLADVISKSGLEEKIKSLSEGVETRLMKGVFENSVDLSGGEKQKLMLARALYKDAPVIVLDEPTAALDPIAESELYLKYSSLTKNKTSVFISHRLASTRFCDRIVFIENGEIVEEGTHDELMALGGKYAYMYKVQSKYYKEGDENE